jgi:hypothetical protein
MGPTRQWSGGRRRATCRVASHTWRATHRPARVSHAFKGGPKPTAAVRSCRHPTAPVREHTGLEPSCAVVSASGATHFIEAELTLRCAILHQVAGRELSAPSTALPPVAAGPSSPLNSPLSLTQVTARRATSSPAPQRHRLLLTSIRPPHLLPVCCLLSSCVAVAGAALCHHAA